MPSERLLSTSPHLQFLHSKMFNVFRRGNGGEKGEKKGEKKGRAFVGQEIADQNITRDRNDFCCHALHLPAIRTYFAHATSLVDLPIGFGFADL
jgi:hypothetical protein